jgi:S1-C subfamily serine protease
MSSVISIAAAVFVGLLPVDQADSATDRARVIAAQSARVETIQRLVPSVVCLFNKGDQAGGGSGVLIDKDGYGLTNFHVVAGMLKDRQGDAGLVGGRLVDMDILGIDPGGDVAMFRIDPKERFNPAPLGDSNELAVGDYTLAMGNPFGLADDYAPTITHGIISGLHRFQAGVRGALTYTDCIQVDTSINPGNSGGPLFDMSGRLIGINGRIAVEERNRVNVGVGFAISINQVKRFMPMLRAGLVTPHATAGFTVRDQALRVLVDEIEDRAAARTAGLQHGDELIRFAGRDIHSANDFLNILGTLPAEWPVEVVFRRDGEVRRFNMRLAAVPLPKLTRDAPNQPRPTFDPYGPHPVTTKANRRAVRRAIELFQKAAGSNGVWHDGVGLRGVGARTPAGAHEGRGEAVSWRIAAGSDESIATDAIPDSVEAAIWSDLLSMKADKPAKGLRVVASDEVRGRICAVVERKMDNRPVQRLCFDDETGELLAVEFTQGGTGIVFRYEYGSVQSVGAMRMPRARRVYRGETLFAEDSFTEMAIEAR